MTASPTEETPCPDVPEEVEGKFLDRLKAALRGDDDAAEQIGKVLEGAAREEVADEEKEKGLFASAIGFVTDTAGSCWETATSWTKLSDLAVGTSQKLLIDTIDLAFKAILTVPLGTKFTGDTVMLAAVQTKAVLYHLNGWEISEEDREAWGDYIEEVKRITGYLSAFGLRAGLFALPGIGAIASATIGKHLEEKIRESFPEDPEIIDEIQAMIPR